MDKDVRMVSLQRTTNKIVRRFWNSLGIKIISPLFISLLNTFVALGAAFVPSDLVVKVLSEPNVIYLNMPYILVVLSSEIAFCAGIWLFPLLKGQHTLSICRSPTLYPTRRLYLKALNLVLISILYELFIIIFMIVSIGQKRIELAFLNPNIANTLRLWIISASRVHGVNLLAFQFGVNAALLVSFFIFINIRLVRVRISMLSIHALASMLYLLASSLSLSRWPIMAYLLSLAVLVVLKKNAGNGIGIRRVVVLSLSTLSILVFVFMVFSYIRMGSENIARSIVGYTIGSYNLGSAAISNIFVQPYSDSTYGALGMFWNAPVIGPYLRYFGRALGLDLPRSSVIEMGKTVVLWSDAVSKANFNPTYLWDSIYGFLYSDISFWYLFVFFVYGFVSWYLYDGFIKLSLLKMLLYIVFFISLITWFTSAFISNLPLDDFTFFAVLIALYLRRQWRLSF
ncbi:MAG: hypothetical protein M0003_14845 [Acidithiobacillus sp.]|nr:hypothetical protein [Acidithiobacillus sp.]